MNRMLETLPELEKELSAVLNRYIQSKVLEFSPATAGIERHVVFEGHRNVLHRETGEEDETNIVRFSGESEISWDSILYGTFQEILDNFLPAAEAMASEQTKMLFEAISEATEKTGNTVDGKGKPFSFDLVLEVLEKMHFSFDRDGTPHSITAVVGQDMAPVLEALENDPQRAVFQRKFEELIARKRLDWRAAEANRTLVG